MPHAPPINIVIKRDGIGLRGDYQSLIKYGSDWNEVSSMCTNSGQLYVAHGSGVDEVSLATLNVVRAISAGRGECLVEHTAVLHGDGHSRLHKQPYLMETELLCQILRVQSHRVLKWSRCKQNVQVNVFAGDGTPGNNDGLATKCRHFQPSGICSEFNNVVYTLFLAFIRTRTIWLSLRMF